MLKIRTHVFSAFLKSKIVLLNDSCNTTISFSGIEAIDTRAFKDFCGRLGSKAAALTKFIADRAKESKTPCVLIGASALIVRGIIRRETYDVDFNIAPRRSLELQNTIKPRLDQSKREAVLVDGKTPQLKALQTSFRIFKSFEGKSVEENMKADISENRCALLSSAYSDVDGVMVATLPLVVVFKICAITRPNRPPLKQVTDISDLVDVLNYLVAHGETVADELQELFAHEVPPFSWRVFWEQLDPSTSVILEDQLHRVGIAKTRD
ncbi:hypothetical protein EW146_g322 [Bondarzewia mesenterica]|uniref:Uncharacterized protein n=1 Tax=Bondarzewia mesenterica TaxID=1095465 RepID=A0A4S4M7I2_9AGAM|nr:hypothetical protein EW146_g322 [Bondarzewia mesenterica]